MASWKVSVPLPVLVTVNSSARFVSLGATSICGLSSVTTTSSRSTTVIVVVLDASVTGVPARSKLTIAVFSMMVPAGVPAAFAVTLSAIRAHALKVSRARDPAATRSRVAVSKVHSFAGNVGAQGAASASLRGMLGLSDICLAIAR